MDQSIEIDQQVVSGAHISANRDHVRALHELEESSTRTLNLIERNSNFWRDIVRPFFCMFTIEDIRRNQKMEELKSYITHVRSSRIKLQNKVAKLFKLANKNRIRILANPTGARSLSGRLQFFTQVIIGYLVSETSSEENSPASDENEQS